jgi:hypothetical protein
LTPTPAELLEAARRQTGLSVQQLWLDQALLGGETSAEEVGSFLSGATTPNAHQYDLLAHALNEVFVDRGLNHPIPYAEDS